jgi:polyribonucleotide nucleotidyltransferase
MSQSFQCTVGERLLTIETGKLAQQADSAVTVQYGDTIVLVTICMGEGAGEEADFLRLTVDYEERHYAVGKIPGSFIRREGRPSENATLTGRLVDRSLRPLFPKGLRNEIQVIVTVLSTDQENDPDILAVIGASTALTISSIPFDGPIGAVRVGYLNGNLVLNPKLPQMNDSLLDLMVVSTEGQVVMLEAGAKEIPEEILIDAVSFGHETCREVIRLQENMQQAIGKPKREVQIAKVNDELLAVVSSGFGDKLAQAVV